MHKQTIPIDSDYRQWIDICKAVACIVVLYYHVRLHTWVGATEVLASGRLVDLFGLITLPFKWGGLGVAIFFVLSGYCIHSAYKDRVYDRNSLSAFYLGRILKIYPVLIFSCAIVYLIVEFLKFPKNVDLGIIDWISFLNTLNPFAFADKTYFGFNGVIWTLILEIQLYIAYPFLNFLYRRVGLASFIKFILFVNIISIAADLQFFTSYLISWWLGALLAEIDVSSNKLASYIKKGRCCTLGVVLVLTLALIADFFGASYIRFILWSFSFFIILCFLKYQRLNEGIVLNVLSQIGKGCFTIYVAHIPVLYVIHYIILNGNREYNIFYSFFVSCLVLFVCYLFYVVVEKRIDVSRKYFLKNKLIS